MRARNTRAARLWIVVAILVSCVGCDQVTKSFASRELEGRAPLSFLGDTVRIQYIENTGVFLGLGSNLPPPARTWIFVGLVSLVLVAFSIYSIRSHGHDTRHLVAAALIVAGGAGNLVDRVLFGSVRDFLNVGVMTLRTGIFNVADMAITAGVVLLLIQAWRSGSATPPASSGPAHDGPGPSA